MEMGLLSLQYFIPYVFVIRSQRSLSDHTYNWDTIALFSHFMHIREKQDHTHGHLQEANVNILSEALYMDQDSAFLQHSALCEQTMHACT